VLGDERAALTVRIGHEPPGARVMVGERFCLPLFVH
jgi:hypothetical protein